MSRTRRSRVRSLNASNLQMPARAGKRGPPASKIQTQHPGSVEERRVVARERGLRDLAREGEHGQAAVLELGVLLAAQLDRVRGLEDAAELEVPGLAVAVHRRDAGRDARERLEEADEEEDLAHRAGRDEPVVRLPADVGALELLARHAHERGTTMPMLASMHMRPCLSSASRNHGTMPG